MSIEKIANIPPPMFGGHDIQLLDDFIECVDEALVKQHAAIGTTQLVRLILPRASDAQVKNLVAWLRLGRRENKFGGYFTQGKPAFGTFGKPRLLWLLSPDMRNSVANSVAILNSLKGE